MATVIKGNVLLNIPDSQLSDYVARGYDIASVEGTVIKKAVPDDKTQLQKLYTEQQATIVRLEKELAEYKRKYENLLAAGQEPEVEVKKVKRSTKGKAL